MDRQNFSGLKTSVLYLPDQLCVLYYIYITAKQSGFYNHRVVALVAD